MRLLIHGKQSNVMAKSKWAWLYHQSTIYCGNSLQSSLLLPSLYRGSMFSSVRIIIQIIQYVCTNHIIGEHTTIMSRETPAFNLLLWSTHILLQWSLVAIFKRVFRANLNGILFDNTSIYQVQRIKIISTTACYSTQVYRDDTVHKNISKR